MRILKRIILSILLYAIYILIGGYSFNIKFFFGILYCFIYSIHVFQQRFTVKEKGLFIFILLLPFSIIVYLHIVDFKDTLTSLPSTIAAFTGVVLAYFYSKITNNQAKILFLAICVSVVAYLLIFGFEKYYNYINYGSVSNRINEEIPQIELFDINNLETNIEINDTVVYFLWHNGCGICKSLFPELEKISRLYKFSHTKVYAVNIPYKGNDTFALAESFTQNYSFNNLYAKDKIVAEKLNIKVYPTVIIIHNNKIIFRGSFEQAIMYLS